MEHLNAMLLLAQTPYQTGQLVGVLILVVVIGGVTWKFIKK